MPPGGQNVTCCISRCNSLTLGGKILFLKAGCCHELCMFVEWFYSRYYFFLNIRANVLANVCFIYLCSRTASYVSGAVALNWYILRTHRHEKLLPKCLTVHSNMFHEKCYSFGIKWYIWLNKDTEQTKNIWK